MGFFSTLFGGPSSQEQNLANQSSSLANSMSAAFQQRLGTQNQIYQNLNQQLTPIANLGPGQRGGSPEQWAAENTLAINNAAASARNARQAVSTQLAGQGGGGASGQTSGIQQQIAGTLASNAENQLSNATEENLSHQYDVGNQDFFKATAGEQALGNAQDAAQFGQEAGVQNASAFGQQSKVNSEKGSVLGDIGKVVGLGGQLLGGFIGNGLNNLSSDSSFGENVGNFFKGAANPSGTGTPYSIPAGQSALSGGEVDEYGQYS